MNLFIVSSLPGTAQLLLYILILLFLYTASKLQWVPLKNNLLLPPTSITNYHTKVSQHMMLHYTESLHRLSAAGWLKSSSPEFPQLASVIKVDEGRRLARQTQKWSFAWGSLCSVYGERLLCRLCFTRQNMHCLQLTHGIPLQLSPSLRLLVDVLSIVKLLLGC